MAIVAAAFTSFSFDASRSPPSNDRGAARRGDNLDYGFCAAASLKICLG
ncbi:hypothetical protein PC116_g26826 [Phytophthora cactorum]|uniref:Uncharacterized protein n=1 Tax=Phytophthora cactorum TaxID=29920 RepID=A0A8T1JJ60_9STRA|nr:hypothetical protein Pcac1_g19846 [Phytophthora cactorum]KAG2916742.1 hypothetical protein PC117_g17653 [Phytophthora cactorum]KAG2992712.1 hypothetical protein PC120_g22416 [Phytophthora cactorum]KAG3191017.1 hypothetical protein PC128_g11101 [Phytophthora cactorum]KAG4041637.1 hypothetical protein PC123_g22855 [Phytophthora cactorum]